MKIFHAADIHLGRRRLDGRLPDKDFAEAFAFIADRAIDENAEAFLLAGDLFDRPQVEPPHLRQAQKILAKLKQARIPVIAIEGNHDKASIHGEATSWLQYLAEDRLLILLQTRFDESGPLLTEWENPHTGGAWIDLGKIRFVGAGYLGAATPHKVREIAERLEPARTHVLLLHAGPKYFTGEGGGFSKEDLETLRKCVAYLALGHIHKPMLHEGWACNPGSPENCDSRESEYDRDREGNPIPRGFAVAEIDPRIPGRPVSLEIRSNPRRPCKRLVLDCTAFGDQMKNHEALLRAATDLLRSEKLPPESLVHLSLSGRLDLSSVSLDQPVICAALEKAAEVFAVTLDLTELNLQALTTDSQLIEVGMTREKLEKNAIREMVDGKPLWGLDGLEGDFAEFFYNLKESVRTGRSGEELAEQVQHHPLVGMVQKTL